MQREYIDGDRARHQKPFSMFFICGTLSGLGYYLFNVAYRKIYGQGDFASEDFYRHYFIVLQALSLPLYTLITWLCSKNKKYNYAETLIMMLYNLSFVFLVLVPIVAVNLLIPDFENRIVEVIFLLIYSSVTYMNFYQGRKWMIILRTAVSISICYLCSQLLNELSLEILR